MPVSKTQLNPQDYVSAMAVRPRPFALRDYGKVLATRNVGRKVAAHLRDRLETGDDIVLSFRGVEAVTPPFLDEVLRTLQPVLAGSDERPAVVTSGMNADVKETIGFVAERNKLALAELKNQRLELLGADQFLRETLDAAQQLGQSFTAPELAAKLSLTLPNVNQRLGALTASGVVARRRDPTAKRGKRYVYVLPGRMASNGNRTRA
jgi:hypothetical protein